MYFWIKISVINNQGKFQNPQTLFIKPNVNVRIGNVGKSFGALDYNMKISAIVCSNRETTWKHINFAECSAPGIPDMNCMFNYHRKSCSLQRIARISSFLVEQTSHPKFSNRLKSVSKRYIPHIIDSYLTWNNWYFFIKYIIFSVCEEN